MQQVKHSVVAKYLARHAAPEAGLARSIGRALSGPYDAVCVVPALAEPISLVNGLAPAAHGARPLYILVVNAGDSDDRAHAGNAELLVGLRNGARRVVDIADDPPMWLCEGLVAQATDTLLDILLIDRSSLGWRIPRARGVGLARCIGCDVALALCHEGAAATRWIHTTDADVILSPRYFAAARQAPAESVALTYPFWHHTRVGDEGTALALYELSLRYYVLGLRWASSPYAHHTIGSTLAVDATAYATVRGIPKRRAAEDFYLINKLAKVGPIVQPDVAPIRIRQRVSQRVPFGTGPAMSRIADQLARERRFCLYHPRSFAAVKHWLAVMDRFARDPDAGLALGGVAPELDRGELDALEAALAELGARQALDDARARVTTPAALATRVHGWFDGFRTLKLIHGLRDAGLTDQPWEQALRQAPFLPAAEVASGLPDAVVPAFADVEAVRRALFALDTPAAATAHGDGDPPSRALRR